MDAPGSTAEQRQATGVSLLFFASVYTNAGITKNKMAGAHRDVCARAPDIPINYLTA